MSNPELTTDEIDRLVSAATEARLRAFAEHSNFLVGAALLLPDGEIIIGCNVENASYSMCLCAERVAAASAVAAGHRYWRAVAVVTKGGVSPCGACRQFLSEFALDTWVIMADVEDGSHRIKRLSELLPDVFDASSLPGT